MSIENAKKFYEKVRADQSLKQKLTQLVKESPNEIGTVIVKTAKDNGFEFTGVELKAFMMEMAKKIYPTRELGDSELEWVVGGIEERSLFAIFISD